MTFIRAPFIEEVGPGVEVLAVVDEPVVAAKYKNQIALAFHPELDIETSNAIHSLFLGLCKSK